MGSFLLVLKYIYLNKILSINSKSVSIVNVQKCVYTFCDKRRLYVDKAQEVIIFLHNYHFLFIVFFNLKVFNITVMLLNTIAKLAIIGLIEIPSGFNIPIAIGIIKQL